ncbi:MAG: hypothetical protein AAF570_03955 [Bacteroidota bacterium]
MKRYFHILAILALAVGLSFQSGCKSGPKGDKETKKDALPEALAKAYQEDAARMTLREILSSNQSGEREAELPKERVAYFYDLLSKIYWMSEKDEEIPKISHIHTFGSPSLNQILTVLEKDAEFKENWANGRTMSSNLYLNQLMSRYKLKIKNYRDGALGPTMILESPMYVNTTELAFLLSNIDGIRHAEAQGMVGDGNDISFGGDGKNHVAVKYSIGKGDCPSGCIHRKYWIFYLNDDGSISYQGTRGSLPEEGEE